MGPSDFGPKTTGPASLVQVQAAKLANQKSHVLQALQTAPTQPSSGLGGLSSLLQPSKAMTLPPLVSELCGAAPKSFPLALCHAGR